MCCTPLQLKLLVPLLVVLELLFPAWCHVALIPLTAYNPRQSLEPTPDKGKHALRAEWNLSHYSRHMGELVDLLASLCTGSHENISNISHLRCTLQIYIELQMLHATTRKTNVLSIRSRFENKWPIVSNILRL